jgi:hypothetical protein
VTLPALLWHALRQLQPLERLALVAWIWVAWGARSRVRRRARRETLAINGAM